MGIKITFEGPTIDAVIRVMQDFIAKASDSFHPETKTEEAAKPTPAPKKTRAKKEAAPAPVDEEDSLGEDVPTETVEVSPTLTIEGDLIPAFAVYKKRVEAKLGKDKALAQCRNILAKFGAKSVRELQSKDLNACMEYLK